MELSAKLLHDVEFKQSWRGYDPEEVDAFLEQLARDVEALQERLDEAERAGRRPRKVVRSEAPTTGEVPVTSSSDDELRRILVLAQRTADTAVREATEQAEQLVADARRQAEALTAEADAYAARVRREADEDVARRMAEAEAEVERAGSGARQRLEDQVAALEADRARLEAEVAGHEVHLLAQRSRAERTIAELQRLLDDPASLAGLAVPALAAAAPAALGALDDEPAWDDTADAVALPAVAAAGDEDDDGALDVDADDLDERDALEERDDLDEGDELDDDELDDDELVDDELDDVGAAGSWGAGDEPWAAREGDATIDLSDPVPLLDATADTGELHLGDLDRVPDVAWADRDASDGGPPTQASPVLLDQDAEDDDDPLGQEALSPAAEAFFTQAAYEDDRWKGLRRRR